MVKLTRVDNFVYIVYLLFEQWSLHSDTFFEFAIEQKLQGAPIYYQQFLTINLKNGVQDEDCDERLRDIIERQLLNRCS